MPIYEELKKDHEALKKVLHQLADAESHDERQELVTKVRDLMVPHSRAEEAVFYNVLRQMDEVKDKVSHGYQEHVAAETLLRALQVTEAVHVNWKAGVEKLIVDIEHHIEEEEGEIFPAAKEVLTNEEAQQIGKAFRELKPKVGANVISSNIELMANLIPARFKKPILDKLGADDNQRHAS